MQTESLFWRNKKVLLTGGGGFLGRFIIKELLKRAIRSEDIFIPRSREYDLRQREVCQKIVGGQDIVIHAAASLGGIEFNRKNSGRIFFDNAAMALHLIDAAQKEGVQKFIGIGSISEYSEDTPSPFQERSLWGGVPKGLNAPYALAKRVMCVQSRMYAAEYGFNAIHILPVKLYGPGMSFDPENSQVIAALIAKIAGAKKRGEKVLEVWGSGKARREFLYVEDAAEAIVLAAEKYNDTAVPLNIGSGADISIKELVEAIARAMDFRGEIRWDATKPEGQLRSCADVSRAQKLLGWTAKTGLSEGLERVVKEYSA